MVSSEIEGKELPIISCVPGYSLWLPAAKISVSEQSKLLRLKYAEKTIPNFVD